MRLAMFLRDFKKIYNTCKGLFEADKTMIALQIQRVAYTENNI